MRLQPPLRLKLRRFARARRSGGHEVHLPAPFARCPVDALDLVGLVRLELQPPLRSPADVIPDALHRFSGKTSRSRIRCILSRTAVDARGRVTERLIEIRNDAVYVESHPDAHA